MERRKALAVAAAATVALGSAIVVVGAAGGLAFLGPGTSSSAHAATAPGTGASPQTIVRKRNLYDRYVIDVPTETTTVVREISAPGTEPDAASSTTVGAPAPTPTTQARHDPGGDDESPDPSTPTTRASSPTSTATTTTTVPTTTTTIRPGGVPGDWPPDEPIPPVPPNCREQRLTLDGVWHCDD